MKLLTLAYAEKTKSRVHVLHAEIQREFYIYEHLRDSFFLSQCFGNRVTFK